MSIKPAEAPLSHQIMLSLVKEEMAAAGVVLIEVEFNGEGDSGDLSNYTLLTKAPDAGTGGGTYLDYEAAQAIWNKPIGPLTAQIANNKELNTIGDIIAAWSWKFADGVNVDWVNNEGGRVTVEFDLSTGKIEVEAEVRVVSFETEETGTYSLDTFDAVEDTEEHTV